MSVHLKRGSAPTQCFLCIRVYSACMLVCALCPGGLLWEGSLWSGNCEPTVDIPTLKDTDTLSSAKLHTLTLLQLQFSSRNAVVTSLSVCLETPPSRHVDLETSLCPQLRLKLEIMAREA